MADSERWKPVLFCFLFSLGFFVFSQAPFTSLLSNDVQPIDNLEVADIINHIQKRSVDSQIRADPVLSVEEDEDDEDSNASPGGIRFERTPTSSSSSSEESAKLLYRRKNRRQRKKYLRDSDLRDFPLKNHKRKRTNSGTKRKATPTTKTPENNNSKFNPRPPLDLPIVKPEMLIDNPSAKIIPTKSKPFHFHIPIVSANPEAKPNIDELLKIAKQYKDPLNYDPVIIQSAVKGNILTAEQLSSIKRMVRDSPVLDFLNLGAVLTNNKRDADLKSEKNGRSDNIDWLNGYKRDLINLTATDELLQEIIGDEDDLLSFEESTWPKSADAPHGVAIELKVDNSDFSSTLESVENNVRRKRQEVNFYENNHKDMQISHHRAKRGLGKWIKNLFGKKDSTTTTSTTTTTTTKAPNKKSKNKEPKVPKYFALKTDKNGDTEVDKLLPIYLRRSSYLKRNNNKKKDKNSEEQDKSFEEPNHNLVSSDEAKSAEEDDKKKKKRSKRDSQTQPDFYYGNVKYRNVNPIPYLRNSRSISPARSYSSPSAINHLNSNSILNNIDFFGSDHLKDSVTNLEPVLSKQMNSPPLLQPFQPSFQVANSQQQINTMKLSKDELKVINEILLGIIKERCFSLNSDLIEKFQQTVSVLVDASSAPSEFIHRNQSDADLLLQQIGKCSSDPEKIFHWKTERDALKKQENLEKTNTNKKYTDFESGSPLLRTKRIIMEDISAESPMVLHAQAHIIPNIIEIVTQSCKNSVDSSLIQSAGRILVEILLNEVTNPILKEHYQTYTDQDADYILKYEEGVELSRSIERCLKWTESTKKVLTNSGDIQELQTPLLPLTTSSVFLSPSNDFDVDDASKPINPAPTGQQTEEQFSWNQNEDLAQNSQFQFYHGQNNYFPADQQQGNILPIDTTLVDESQNILPTYSYGQVQVQNQIQGRGFQFQGQNQVYKYAPSLESQLDVNQYFQNSKQNQGQSQTGQLQNQVLPIPNPSPTPFLEIFTPPLPEPPFQMNNLNNYYSPFYLNSYLPEKDDNNFNPAQLWQFPTNFIQDTISNGFNRRRRNLLESFYSQQPFVPFSIPFNNQYYFYGNN